jgi:hypothetical protein
MHLRREFVRQSGEGQQPSQDNNGERWIGFSHR